MNFPARSAATDLETVKLFLVDDHTLFRQGLRRILEEERNLVVIGEASNGAEALQKVELLPPDIMILDLCMPYMNGLETARRMEQSYPATRVILLTMYENLFVQEEGKKVGIAGFLSKKSVDREVFEAIREVYSGRTYFIPLPQNGKTDRSSVTPSFYSLSSREREILCHLANGMRNQEIAQYLSISVNTVETHRKNLMKKLRLHDLSGIIRYAKVHGMITP